MRDYDVVVIGGGINGLTVAAYLAKAGQSVGLFEARGQCGAHCDTIEPGLPGFLHNQHAVWIVPALCPAMTDLDLEGFGLELMGTDVLMAKALSGGRNLIHAMDPAATNASIARISERDAKTRAAISGYLMEHAMEVLTLNQAALYKAPSHSLLDRLSSFHDGLLRHLGLPMSGDDVQRLSAFEVLDTVYESDQVRTMIAGFCEFTAHMPVDRKSGATAMGLCGLPPLPVHMARGGVHGLTHALVKAFVAHGGDLWTTCPVERILVREGRVRGVRLSDDAVFPGEEVTAETVVSNVTLAPTMLGMVGDEVLGPEMTRRVRSFSYDNPGFFTVCFSLKGDPEFASATWDPAIQRSWAGYYGGETTDEMRTALGMQNNGVIPDQLSGGWYIPTRADPSQAPPGCHTLHAWACLPTSPRRWRGRRLSGWSAWEELREPLTEAIVDRIEGIAPGFRDLILERHTTTLLDTQNNNASAVRGNGVGGAVIAGQVGIHRPVPGIMRGGASRTFIPGLYLSNSIFPYGATHLATGYIAATEAAEDLGCRDAPWWNGQPYMWFLQNMGRLPLNRGVAKKWLAEGRA